MKATRQCIMNTFLTFRIKVPNNINNIEYDVTFESGKELIGQWIYNFEMFDINTRCVKCNWAECVLDLNVLLSNSSSDKLFGLTSSLGERQGRATLA